MRSEILIYDVLFLENMTIFEMSLVKSEIYTKNYRQQSVCEYEGKWYQEEVENIEWARISMCQ